MGVIEPSTPPIQVGLEEAVQLGAVDGIFYSHYWFPGTVRQESPDFHRQMWDDLVDPTKRFLSYQVFRGGAKTTTTRLFTSHRIAYALARTILYIGKSEGHAKRSAEWLKRQVDRNLKWSTAFGLKHGDHWTGTETEVYHSLRGHGIWIIACGIEGAVRGINIDDFRPDFICLDDVINDENAATHEQREKIWDLILGAIKQSLAPRADNPNAKMVMLNTPLDKEDASMKTEHDPEFHFRRFPCWTDDTVDLSVDEQESRWPEAYPTNELRDSKRAYIARNKTSVWYREMECKVIDPETTAFREDWLQYWGESGPGLILPDAGRTIITIDPVPKPTDVKIAKGLHRRDYEVLMVLRWAQRKGWVCEYKMNRGHVPSWTIAMFWQLVYKWNPGSVVVSMVQYETTLQWLLEESMKAKGRYLPVKARPNERRSKFDKIVDPLSGPASQGAFVIHPSMVELKTQFCSYPNVSHDDVLECAAMGMEELHSLGRLIEGETGEEAAELEPVPAEYFGAP